MATTNGARMVEKLKETALRVGTQGVRYVVEGTIAAVKGMDRLQELMPKQERIIRVRREEPALARPIPARPVSGRPAKAVRAGARVTAERILEEARAAQVRIKEARPARKPLKVSGAEELEETPTTSKRRTPARKTTRAQGRKTMASATAPKRASAPHEGFKAKRGQKHRH